MAERIVDITATGTTLRENDLVSGGGRAWRAPRASSRARRPIAADKQTSATWRAPCAGEVSATHRSDGIAMRKVATAPAARVLNATADRSTARPEHCRGERSSPHAAGRTHRPQTCAHRGDARACASTARRRSTAPAPEGVPRAGRACRRRGRGASMADPETAGGRWRAPRDQIPARSTHARSSEESWFSARADGDAAWASQVTPVASAGVYVPGGRAPSTRPPCSWTPLPAAVAGVGRVVVRDAAPAKDGSRSDAATLAACGTWRASTEVYAVGGAQAIGARGLRHGVHPAACDKIAGPGNAYVAAAKTLRVGRRGHRHGGRPVGGVRGGRRDGRARRWWPPTSWPRPSTTRWPACYLVALRRHAARPTSVARAVERPGGPVPARAEVTAREPGRPGASWWCARHARGGRRRP